MGRVSAWAAGRNEAEATLASREGPGISVGARQLRLLLLALPAFAS